MSQACSCFDKVFSFPVFVLASTEAPDINYESIKCTRIRLEDNATCNIGIHFDLVADKIGELIDCVMFWRVF